MLQNAQVQNAQVQNAQCYKTPNYEMPNVTKKPKYKMSTLQNIFMDLM